MVMVYTKTVLKNTIHGSIITAKTHESNFAKYIPGSPFTNMV